MTNKIFSACNRWEELTSSVLSIEPIALSDIQQAIKESYRVLKEYCNKEDVPKEVCRLLLCTDEFLCFASMIEKNECGLDFYHYRGIHDIVSVMKNGFFKGHFEYSYPDSKKEKGVLTVSAENEDILNFLKADKKQICEKYSGIALV